MKSEERKELMPLFFDYINKGQIFSPMNTEPCRKYLEEKYGKRVEAEDVLWLFYHSK